MLGVAKDRVEAGAWLLLVLGSVDISSSPDEESNEVQEGHEVVSGVLETRKDAAILFDLVEKAFDRRAFLVKDAGRRPWGSGGWNGVG